MSRLRPSVAWTLGITLALTGVALWLPSRPTVGPANSVSQSLADSASSAMSSTASATPQPLLPAELPQLQLEPALADPFSPPAPASAMPVPVATAAPPPTAEPVPSAPPTRYRFVGQMSDPNGLRRVYLANDRVEVLAAVGMTLDDGYTIELVEPGAVRLLHVASGTRASIEIPAAAAVQ